jgi:hypothetical protein
VEVPNQECVIDWIWLIDSEVRCAACSFEVWLCERTSGGMWTGLR